MTICQEGLIKQSGRLAQLLVATQSSQPEGNEAEIISKIDSLFPRHIFRHKLDHGDNRASLLIKIEGAQHDGALAFVGHVDTVALGDLSQWTYPPLDATERDGILYGRGAADMKGGVAAMITAAQCVIQSGKTPARDLLFCFTADEEANGMGVQAIVKAGLLDHVSEVIIAEPSEQKIGLCEKGAIWLRLEAHGVSAHGSRPEIGLNAVEALMEFQRRLAANINTSHEHRLLGCTTISVTRLNGGIMTNVIPEEAVMELDIRTLPSLKNEVVLETARRIVEEMCAADSRLTLKITVLNDRLAVETPESASMVQKMKQVFAQYDLDPTPRGLYFYTDMSQIAPRVNVPFLILGPGDDKQAHKINEHAPIRAIETIARVYTTYIENFYMGDS